MLLLFVTICHIIVLIGSLHNGMSATVTVGGGMRTFLTPK